jgi:progressive ankylosis protein
LSYGRLLRFILPLAITAIVMELGSQVLNGGMARVPQVTTTLAAFGVGWGLVLFISAPVGQMRELGLALVGSHADLAAVRRFVVVAGIILMAGLATLTLTPLGDLLIEELHGIDGTLGATVRVALFWLIPYPMIRGLAFFHAGLLLRVRRTAIVSYATLSNLAVSILMVFVLVTLPWIHAEPIRLPVVVTYGGLLVELFIILWGVARYVMPRLPSHDAKGAPPPSQLAIVRFFWPLALIISMQEMSRPVINLFVARGPDATNALAILAVIYTLGRIPYGWLNDIRNLSLAFRDDANNRYYIRRFAIGCGFVSLAASMLLFWTPLRDIILRDWIGVPAELIPLAVVPLHLFAGFSIAVAVRAYYQGIGIVERRTSALAPSAPARLAAIVLCLVILSWLGVNGATMGVAALLVGFGVEAVMVWWGVRGHQWLRVQRVKNELAARDL